MPKFYFNPDDRDQCAAAMNENIWFKMNQRTLIGMANTSYGRDLLCIPKEYPRIGYIAKNCLHCLLENDGRMAIILADFRIGAKWANVIRYRWEQFNSYARYFQYGQDYSVPMSRMTREALAMSCDTLTAYPDPHPESTTCDGDLRVQTLTTWAATQGAATGDYINDSDAVRDILTVQKDSSSAWTIRRAIFLFNTSSIGAGKSVTDATFSFYQNSTKVLQDNDAQAYATIVSSNPASNTGLSTADYDQVGDAIDNPTKLSNDFAFSSLSSTPQYDTWTLNTAGKAAVSLTGVTKLGIREGHDIEDSEISVTGRNEYGGNMSESAGTGTDPKLIITYITPSTTKLLMMFGVGV